MDFQIVIDTREKAPYSFACGTVLSKLEAGDYSVVGFEDKVAVERKSLADFVHTVVHDFGRFAAELEKLGRCESACVAVEADLSAVLRGEAVSECRGVTGQSLLGASAHIMARYGVPVFWCGSRQAARAFTEAWLRSFVRQRARKEMCQRENNTVV